MTESNSAGRIPAQRTIYKAQKSTRQSIRAVVVNAIALSCCCVLLTQLIFPAHFETVEDINFTLLLSGVGLTHSPTYLTWFTNVLITYPLMCLFKVLPEIPWYSAYLFSVLITGFAIIAMVLMLCFNRAVGGVLFLIYFILIGAFLVNGLQYTSATVLLTQAGFLLLCCLPLTRRVSAKSNLRWMLIVGVAATIFASMMCFEHFMLVTLFGAVTAVAAAAWNTHLLKRNSKPLICFALAVMLGLGLKLANDLYYDSQPIFTGIRELLKPFGDIAGSDRQYHSGIKLSENDFALVKQFFVADRQIYTTAILKQAAEQAELPFTSSKLQGTLRAEVLPLFLLCLIMLPLLDARIMSKARLIVWFAGASSLIIYLTFLMKLPPRLHLEIMTCAITTLFVFMDRQKLKSIINRYQRTEKTKKAVATLVLCAVTSWYTFSTISALHSDVGYYSDKLKRISQAIQRLNPQPGHLYIVLGNAAPYQYMRPFQNLRKYFANFDIYRTGLWGILPIGYDMLENHGISSLLDACKSQNVYFVSDQKSNQLFADFCAEHYKRRPLFVCVFADPSADFEVYRMKFKPL